LGGHEITQSTSLECPVTRSKRAVLLVAVPALSVGWVVPLYLAATSYLSGAEDWLFRIGTGGGAFKVSRFIGTDIMLPIALGWFAVVIAGWTTFGTWQLTKR
jgi:hypothetical protein